MSSSNLEFNKILVTGGSGGLGLAFTKLFLEKGKKVIIAGRTASSLESAKEDLSKTYSGKVSTSQIDLQNIKHFPEYVEQLLAEHPDLDAICLNAGIQKPISYAALESTEAVKDILQDTDDEITTNILSVVHLTTVLMPHLLKQPKAVICTVSSGLAFVPKAGVPVYCATKAFIHSWTLSLRYQLEKTNVRVIEVAPPLVESNLHRDHDDPDNNKKSKNSAALTVKDFITEVDQKWSAGDKEIAAGFAANSSKKWYDAYGEQLEKMNEGV
ncbi:Predicted dehydrogenase [Phaffia rhodozyma]|uniref:Predicted dehydrogenase n=1 Tax=Phaffia rhodozyma TaxID=264483 RepID=A0A0F7SFM9_PHARH|nr:Predicted dehydrogenase [Phaffia rhodozyma]